jgi:sugar/nucleoside kinase (ribokinase family)
MPLEVVRDPTGAGDTFAGGMLGYMARTGNIDSKALRQAVVMGNVMASFVVEDFSLDRLRTLTRADLRERLAQFQSLVRFDAGSIDA